jgi:signal peptidase II
MRRSAVLFIAILAFTVAFDQGSKAWARTLPVAPSGCAVPGDLLAHRCAGVPQSVVSGYWDWDLSFNRGAAFSTFTGEGGDGGAQLVLGLIAAIALIAIGISAWRSQPEQQLRRAAFALIAAGTLGNLIDRVRDGAVTDFVFWHFHDHPWPIFNVADAALLVGVAVLLVDGARAHRKIPALA